MKFMVFENYVKRPNTRIKWHTRIIQSEYTNHLWNQVSGRRGNSSNCYNVRPVAKISSTKISVVLAKFENEKLVKRTQRLVCLFDFVLFWALHSIPTPKLFNTFESKREQKENRREKKHRTNYDSTKWISKEKKWERKKKYRKWNCGIFTHFMWPNFIDGAHIIHFS